MEIYTIIYIFVYYNILRNNFFFVIGASNETLAKLRICTVHFSEEMIIPFGKVRRLKNDALPTVHISLCVSGNTCRTDPRDIITSDVLENPDLVPILTEEHREECGEPNTVQPIVHVSSDSRKDVSHLRIKVRQIRKMLYSKNRTIAR